MQEGGAASSHIIFDFDASVLNKWFDEGGAKTFSELAEEAQVVAAYETQAAIAELAARLSDELAVFGKTLASKVADTEAGAIEEQIAGL